MHAGHDQCENEGDIMEWVLEEGEGKGKEAASVQMYTVTFDHSIKDNQGRSLNPEVFYGSGSCSDSERQIDVITGGESGENKSLSASTIRSSSSCLSDSSSDPDAFFGTDASNFATSDASGLISKSETDNSPRVPPSIDQLYNLSFNEKVMSPTASPPMQMMDRSGGYSSRIPSSVFERNTNASEWSVASNESLFSIQLGLSSFRRENPFLVGELVIPEELTKSGELNVFNQTPPVIVEEIDTARIKHDTENLQTTGTSDETFKSERKLSKDGNQIKTLHEASKSDLSEFSNGSGSSVPSFVPLKKRSRSSWCCCFNHSWAHCCYKWASCNCSSCGWALCSCWNCSHINCCGSPVLTETDRNSFKNADILRHQSFKQESETTNNSSSSWCNCFQSKQASDEVTSKSSCADCCHWFHCFSCPSCSWKISCAWRPSCARCKSCC